VKITIQFFDGCPHWELAERRLRQAAADIGQEELQITYQRIDSPEDAERSDFHGSPTFLVNGRDPFGGGEAPASLGCRVYQTEEGIQGAPSVPQLRHVLRSSSQLG